MPKNSDRMATVALDRVSAVAEDAGFGNLIARVELVFSGCLDASRLARACELLLEKFPVLGCRFVVRGGACFWEPAPEKKTVFVLAADRQAYLAFRSAALDWKGGPQFALCLWQAPDEGHVLIKTSHLVCDAGAITDISRALGELYRCLADDPAYVPQPEIRGSRGLEQILRVLPWHAWPVIFLNCCRMWFRNLTAARSHGLALPQDSGAGFTCCLHRIDSCISRLKAFCRQRQVTLNDVLLAAYFRAQIDVGAWDGRAALRVRTPVDLRFWYLQGRQAENLCNLTSYEYVDLGTSPGKDFSATLERVTAVTAARKASWYGLSDLCLLGLFGCFPYGRQVSMLRKIMLHSRSAGTIPPGFTNAGLLNPAYFSLDRQPRHAWMIPPQFYPPLLVTCLTGYGDDLTLSAGVAGPSAPIVERFFSRIAGELTKECLA